MVTPQDKLLELIQDHIRTTEGSDTLVLTELAFVYAATDMRAPADESIWGYATHGGYPTTVGLTQLMLDELRAGDNE